MFSFYKKIYSLHVCEYIMCVCAQEGQKKVSDPWEL